jgi:stage V sporulation protein R
MDKTQLQRLIKIEDRIFQIAKKEGLKFIDIEFDIVPENKMLEIMSYGMPGQISNWKFGRDYERLKTRYDHSSGSLPLEVVVTTDPARAYLMKNNTFAIQALVIAHVVGHVTFSTMNQYHNMLDKQIVSKFIAASKRFEDYERKFGVDILERTVDAGHSINMHSSPFESNETEDEKRDRIFEKIKQKAHDRKPTAYDDMFSEKESSLARQAEVERDLFNHNLWMKLKNKTPVEPTEDLLRYIIDNSRTLSDWQKDILEILRYHGRYIWPHIKTKYMNEGFATYWHEKIMRQLFNEGLMTSEEHAEYNYSNSLVKARNPYSMNPYLIGSEIWKNLVDRWDKGQYGEEWDECQDMEVKRNWKKKVRKNNGKRKMFQTLRTHNDWFFMQNFLTTDLVRELDMYIYALQSDYYEEKIVVTDKMAHEIRELIVNSFSHSGIPKIQVNDGRKNLVLEHKHIGMDLEPKYTKKTLEHIAYLWGDEVLLTTKQDKNPRTYKSMPDASMHGQQPDNTIEIEI